MVQVVCEVCECTRSIKYIYPNGAGRVRSLLMYEKH